MCSHMGERKGPLVSVVCPLQDRPFVNTEIMVFVVLTISVWSGPGMHLRTYDCHEQDLCLSLALPNKTNKHSQKPLCFSGFVFVYTCETSWSLLWPVVYLFGRFSGDYGLDDGRQTQPTSLWGFLDHSPTHCTPWRISSS